jgi:TolB-like protein
VYQVAAFYAVAAWVIVEVASTTFPYLGLSDRAITALIIGALCGFPGAVALGWIFDLTPDGVVVTEPVPTVAAAGGPLGGGSPRRAAARAVLTGAVLILALMGGGWWLQRPPPPPPEPASLIVLPFANLSGDTEDDFFADGIMDEVIAHLSKVGGIRVISRTSAMRYRASERSVPEIAREVGVDAVLEGSVRRTGADVRVTVQLVDGATDGPIWGDQYDRHLENALAVQGDVAREVARALRVRLSPDERRRLRSQPTSSPVAFQAYLRGRYFWNQRSAEGLERAIREFQSALAADPDYSLAYAGLADAYAALAQYAARPPADVMPLARDAALQALALDGSLAEAHASLGMTRFWYDWDWTAADAAYQRALDLNPSYATAAHWRALLLASVGRHDAAWAAIEQAVALDPVSPLIRTGRGLVRFYAGDFAGARDEMMAALDLDPRHPEALIHLGQAQTALGEYDTGIAILETVAAAGHRHPRALGPLGYAYARAGRVADARAVAAELEDRARHSFVPATTVALIHGGLGDLDTMMSWLERGYEERDPFLTSLAVHPAGDVARGHPRFQELLASMKLIPEGDARMPTGRRAKR